MTSRLDARYAVVRKTGVPTGWQEKKIADLVRLVSGGTPNRDDSAYWRDGGTPWITPTDLTANKGKYIREGAEHISEAGLANSNATLVRPGSIVFSTRGTVGSLAIAGVPLTTNQSCETLVPNDGEVSSEFLYYLLNYGMFAFHRLAGGTTFGAITGREIGRVWLAIPDGEEQAAIARVLAAVDAAIDRAREAAAQAAALRKALLSDLLSFGIDPKGRLRKPSDSALVRTEIGLLPNTWRVSEVGREFQIQSGITVNEAQRAGQRRWRYLRVANVQRDALALDDVQTLLARESEVAARLLQQGDLLVVEGHADRRQIGRCALATGDVTGMTFQNHLFRLRTQGEVLAEFGCIWLNSWHAQRYWNAMCSTSSGLNTINQRMLRRLRIAVPSPTEQEKIVALVAASEAHGAELGRKSKALDQLKKSLMHDLLTGSVRVDPALFKQEATT